MNTDWLLQILRDAAMGFCLARCILLTVRLNEMIEKQGAIMNLLRKLRDALEEAAEPKD